MANCSKINNTTIKGTSAVSYDSTPLPCTDVNTCDNLNTVLAKFDAVICNVKANVDALTEDVINITEDVMVITEDVINIQNQLNICCPTTTTTSSSTSTSTTTSTTTVAPTTTTTTTTVEPTTTTTTSSSSSTSTTTSTTSSTSTTTSTTSSTTSTTTSTSSTTTSTTTAAPTCDCNLYTVTVTSEDILASDDGLVYVNTPLSCTGAIDFVGAFDSAGTYSICVSVSTPSEPTQYILVGGLPNLTLDQPVNSLECCSNCIEVTFNASVECPSYPGHANVEYTDCNGVNQINSLSLAGNLTVCTSVTGIEPAFTCGSGTVTYGAYCSVPTTTTTTTV